MAEFKDISRRQEVSKNIKTGARAVATGAKRVFLNADGLISGVIEKASFKRPF
jgi:hypothetical protein